MTSTRRRILLAIAMLALLLGNNFSRSTNFVAPQTASAYFSDWGFGGAAPQDAQGAIKVLGVNAQAQSYVTNLDAPPDSGDAHAVAVGWVIGSSDSFQKGVKVHLSHVPAGTCVQYPTNARLTGVIGGRVQDVHGRYSTVLLSTGVFDGPKVTIWFARGCANLNYTSIEARFRTMHAHKAALPQGPLHYIHKLRNGETDQCVPTRPVDTYRDDRTQTFVVVCFDPTIGRDSYIDLGTGKPRSVKGKWNSAHTKHVVIVISHNGRKGTLNNGFLRKKNDKRSFVDYQELAYTPLYCAGDPDDNSEAVACDSTASTILLSNSDSDQQAPPPADTPVPPTSTPQTHTSGTYMVNDPLPTATPSPTPASDVVSDV